MVEPKLNNWKKTVFKIPSSVIHVILHVKP